MWFGNLVTMKWWNDLWLNESFATYLSHRAMREAQRLQNYNSSWMIFLSYKAWAFREDQMPTTHPIASNCQNTEEAEANFDGITYAKGSSCLKQLAYLIGEQVFAQGVRLYFRRHAWGNTELGDFMASLQKAYDEANPKERIDLG